MLPEFHDCTKAYRNWFYEILSFIDVPLRNGHIEGFNNKSNILNAYLTVDATSQIIEKVFCSAIHKNRVGAFTPTRSKIILFCLQTTINIELQTIMLLYLLFIDIYA
ncbi:MAG: transposase [Oscillospiraceae bacterium]|nr:transposase [Oscillospiraceae bacterium]